MPAIRVTLCPDCDQCPEVEITSDRVTISEGGTVIALTPAQWNDLIARIRRGDLREV